MLGSLRINDLVLHFCFDGGFVICIWSDWSLPLCYSLSGCNTRRWEILLYQAGTYLILLLCSMYIYAWVCCVCATEGVWVYIYIYMCVCVLWRKRNCFVDLGLHACAFYDEQECWESWLLWQICYVQGELPRLKGLLITKMIWSSWRLMPTCEVPISLDKLA